MHMYYVEIEVEREIEIERELHGAFRICKC